MLEIEKHYTGSRSPRLIRFLLTHLSRISFTLGQKLSSFVFSSNRGDLPMYDLFTSCYGKEHCELSSLLAKQKLEENFQDEASDSHGNQVL